MSLVPAFSTETSMAWPLKTFVAKYRNAMTIHVPIIKAIQPVRVLGKGRSIFGPTCCVRVRSRMSRTLELCATGKSCVALELGVPD